MPRSHTAEELARLRRRLWPSLALAKLARSLAFAALATAVLLARASAQAPPVLTFGIEWHGPTVGQPSSATGTPITEADILRPPGGVPAFGPLAKPAIVLTGAQLGVTQYTSCVGHPGGTPCQIEVDAISFGNDDRFFNPPNLFGNPTRIYFSVDEQAIGHVGNTIAPGVRSESSGPLKDQASDIFTSLTLPAGPLAPGAVPPQNIAVFDGNGLLSASGHVYRGVGLVEPDGSGPPPDLGDNLDKLHLKPIPGGPGAAIYYSLDAAFPDPVLGIPNSGSAQLQGVPPAAVLRKLIIGGTPSVYAQPAQLGLDLLGPGTDDLDALILWDNGDGVFQPSQHTYDWQTGLTDMLLFSVRRGSAVVGKLDSIFGLPIVPGDILTTPSTGLVAGNPGIFIAAEDLGLDADRSPPTFGGDELDAAATEREPYYDCNNNGVEDSVDIATGASSDANNNGIPDECERNWASICDCAAPAGPCGNSYSGGGCANSTSFGGILDATGSTSYAMDDLVLSATQLPADKTALWLSSQATISVNLGDGIRCVGNPFYRFGSFNTGSGGAGTKGPGIIASSCSTLPPGGCISAGTTWCFQLWHRDPAGPCGTATNLTNGELVTFTP